MTRYPINKQARHWNEAGIIVGLLVIAANVYALLTPHLSGPFFHPVFLILAVVLVFACAMSWAGMGRDQTERDY